MSIATRPSTSHGAPSITPGHPSTVTRAADVREAGEVRVIEFDLLEEKRADAARVTLGEEWLEHSVPRRPRVVRDAPSGVGSYSLPTLDSAPVAPTSDDFDLVDPEAERRGAAAIAWAVAYRDGVEEGRRAGFAQGHSDGFAEGLERGRELSLDEGRRAAAELLGSFEARTRSTLDDLARIGDEVGAQSTELAVQIAELLLDRELSVSTDPGADAIRRAARLLPDTGAAELEALTARLHPADLDRLSATPVELIAGRSLNIAVDPTVAPGSCVLESGATRVDTSIPAALARVREVLGLPAADGPAVVGDPRTAR